MAKPVETSLQYSGPEESEPKPAPLAAFLSKLDSKAPVETPLQYSGPEPKAGPVETSLQYSVPGESEPKPAAPLVAFLSKFNAGAPVAADPSHAPLSAFLSKMDGKGPVETPVQYSPGPGTGGGGGSFSASIDKTNFGKPEHQIKDEALTADYLGKMGAHDKAAAEAAAAGEEQKASLFAEHYQKLAALEAEQQKAEATRQAWIQSALAKHEEETQKLAKTEISTDHYWSSKDTGQKVTAGIGMALMAFGSGMAAYGGGDPSAGAKMINQIIEQDVAIQKANLDNKWQGLKAKQGLYAARLEAFKDERVAEASTKASLWEGVATKIRAVEAKTTSDLAKQQAGKLADQADYMKEHYLNQVAVAGEMAYASMEAKRAAAAAAADAEIKKRDAEDDKRTMDTVAALQKDGSLPPGPIVRHGVTGRPIAIQTGYDMKTGMPIYQPISLPADGSAGAPLSDKAIKQGEYKLKMDSVTANVIGPDGKVYKFKTGSPDEKMHVEKGMNALDAYIDGLGDWIKSAEAGRTGHMFGGKFNKSGVSLAQAQKKAITGFKNIGGLGSYDAGVERLSADVIPNRPIAYLTQAEIDIVKKELDDAKASKNRMINYFASGSVPAGAYSPTQSSLSLTPVK